jgi:hypothetical protein
MKGHPCIRSTMMKWTELGVRIVQHTPKISQWQSTMMAMMAMIAVVGDAEPLSTMIEWGISGKYCILGIAVLDPRGGGRNQDPT